ncbi:MAG: glycosyltransferase family 4 protein [Minisyncoccia bacterium]
MSKETRKLIYLTHTRVPSEKTPSPFILKTCEGFVAEGWDAELWAAQRRNPDFEEIDPFEHHGVKTRVPIQRLFTVDLIVALGGIGFVLMVITYNISVAAQLWRRRNEKDLVVYAHDLRDLILPILVGIPTFCEIHDYYESSMPLLSRFVIRRVKGLVVTNSIKMTHLHERYGVEMEKMLMQPNAVDFAFFHTALSQNDAREEIGIPQGRRVVMYTGHAYPWKGVYTLAEAAAFLGDTYLYFVGGTVEDQERLHAFVQEKNLPRIVLIPHQSHARIPLYLRAADVLVLPNTAKETASREETSPVKLFEYAASGRPIVASDLPSIRDLVSDEEVFFAHPDNPVDFARAIEMAENTEAAGAKVIAAERFARNNGWDARAKTIGDFVERLMA